MTRNVTFTLLPPPSRLLFASLGGLVAAAGLVALAVQATVPSEDEVAARGSEAGIPTLVAGNRPPVEVLVRPANAAHLATVFQGLGYDLTAVRQDAALVPRVYVTALPENLAQVAPVETRKALFLHSILPLVLMANEELRKLRARVRDLIGATRQGGRLSGEDGVWLRRMSARFGIAPNQGLTELLHRVDEIPVSLALAQAIEESGWGTSRFARAGNALFGQRTWSAAIMGNVPAGRSGQATFRVRSFMNLMGAVRSYMHNLNTHPAYADLRALRAGHRAAGQSFDGYALADTLTRYSERGRSYVEQLRSLIRINGLDSFDRARLSSGDIARHGGAPDQG